MIARRLGASDLEIFKTLRLSSLKAAPDAFASDYSVWAAGSDAKWLSFLEEPVFAVLDGELPVGLIGLIPNSKSRMSHRVELAMVWVEPDYRGQGVADLLVQAALEEADAMGCLQAELTVNAENENAVRFYERHGFETVGRTPRAFRTPSGFVDNLMMIKRLDGPEDG